MLILTFLSAPPANAKWAQPLSDTQLDKVFAKGLVVNWNAGVKFGNSAGPFQFSFNARGKIQPKDQSKDFDAKIGLLGDSLGLSVESSKDSGEIHISTHSGGENGHGASVPEGPSTASIFVDPPSNQGGDHDGSGHGGGTITLSFGGNNHLKTNNGVFSITGTNIISEAQIDIALSTNRLPGGSLAKTIRRAMCNGCP